MWERQDRKRTDCVQVPLDIWARETHVQAILGQEDEHHEEDLEEEKEEDRQQEIFEEQSRLSTRRSRTEEKSCRAVQEGHGEEQQEWPEQQEWSDEQQHKVERHQGEKCKKNRKNTMRSRMSSVSRKSSSVTDWDRGAAQGSLSATEELCKRAADQQHRRSVRGETSDDRRQRAAEKRQRKRSARGDTRVSETKGQEKWNASRERECEERRCEKDDVLKKRVVWWRILRWIRIEVGSSLNTDKNRHRASSNEST